MIRLERIDEGRNMARFYLADVQPGLFGWTVVREWGRIGRPGQVRLDLFETAEEAEAAKALKVGEKQRRGYVASQGA